MNATWRYEALHLLRWALGYLPEPHNPGDAGADMALLAPLSETEFRQQARRRPLPEILAVTDLTYRYAWACVDARFKQQPAPAASGLATIRQATQLQPSGYLIKPVSAPALFAATRQLAPCPGRPRPRLLPNSFS